MKASKIKKPSPLPGQNIKNRDSSRVISLTRLFIGFIVVYMLIVFLSGNSKHDTYSFLTRMWGFDNILFYPGLIRFLACLIVLLACFPYINAKIVQFFSAAFWILIFSKLKQYKYVIYLIISALFCVIFYHFRIKYHFLGDMDLRVKQTVAGQYLNSEYLTMYLLNKVHTFLAKNFAFTGYKTFVLQSIVSGGLYVVFACLISNLTGRILLEKVITFLFFISIGAILLFFGYIEIYSVPALSIIIYVYFSLLWVKGKTNFILPFLALILAVALHLMAIGLVPSFFIVLYQKYGKRIPFLKNIKPRPFIILILFLLPVAFKLAAVLHLGDLMPVSESIKAPKVMLLFSSRHLWEFLNSQILASGLYFILLVYFTIKAIRGRLKFDNIMWFYGSASFFMLFIAFVTNKMRGSGDWDICALPAIIVSPMVAYMWFSNVQATGQYKKFKYALVVILVMNFVNSIAWIGINASDKSIKKIESMLENDPGYYYVTKLPSLYNLALSYRANGLKDESLNCYKKIYRKYYNSPEAHINYANQLIEYGKDQEGAAILINLIRMNPYIPVAYPMLFKIYEKYKMQDNIYATVNQLFRNYQINPRICLLNFNKKDLGNYFYYLYRVELQRKDVEKAKIIAGVINQIQAK